MKQRVKKYGLMTTLIITLVIMCVIGTGCNIQKSNIGKDKASTLSELTDTIDHLNSIDDNNQIEMVEYNEEDDTVDIIRYTDGEMSEISTFDREYFEQMADEFITKCNDYLSL